MTEVRDRDRDDCDRDCVLSLMSKSNIRTHTWQVDGCPALAGLTRTYDNTYRKAYMHTHTHTYIHTHYDGRWMGALLPASLKSILSLYTQIHTHTHRDTVKHGRWMGALLSLDRQERV